MEVIQSTPAEALAWITQAINDYVRTLPPSAAGPTAQAAQAAINVLQPLTIAAVPKGASTSHDAAA